MREHPSFARNDERGFTLLELSLAIALIAGLLGLVFFTLYRTQAQATRVGRVADMRQSARTAVQLIEREVRMSGSGWGRIPVVGRTSGGTPDTIRAVRPGYGGDPSLDDSLVLVGAWQANTTISSSMPTPSSILKVQDVTGFADGDLCIIVSPGGTADMFQCTGVNSSSEQIQHNPSSPYNDPGGLSTSYPAGSNVFKITRATYYYDATSFRRPALMRRELSGAPQVVAYNVDGFRVWYQLRDGSRTRQPADLNMIDKVIPVVLTRVPDPRLQALRDSVWAAVRPRTF